ncbi:MAG: hypothetical protein IT430_18130 [Phycisphaerales bacterium]|nr:hypothetical protein [Phycisphaerales bacterium]
MAKYDALRDELRRRGQPVTPAKAGVQSHSPHRITMTFAEIDQLIPGGLPNSAYTYQAWWADERDPKTHVHKLAWLEAGYRVERYDLAARTVTFRKCR